MKRGRTAKNRRRERAYVRLLMAIGDAKPTEQQLREIAALAAKLDRETTYGIKGSEGRDNMVRRALSRGTR